MERKTNDKGLRFKQSFNVALLIVVALIVSGLTITMRFIKPDKDALSNAITEDIYRGTFYFEYYGEYFSSEKYPSYDRNKSFMDFAILRTEKSNSDDTGDEAYENKHLISNVVDRKENISFEYAKANVRTKYGKDSIWLEGSIEGKKNNIIDKGINTKNADNEKALADLVNAMNNFAKDTKSTGENVTVKEEYLVAFNAKDPNLLAKLEIDDFSYKYIANLAIYGALLVLSSLLYITFTNYRKARERKSFNGLINIPIEIYGLLLFVLIVLGSEISRDFHDLIDFITSKSFIDNNVYKYIFSFIFYLLLMVYTSYFTLGIKSIYHDGLSSFVFEKSIIIKLIKLLWQIIVWIWDKLVMILRFIFKPMNNFFKNIEYSNKVIWIIAYIILLFIGLFIGPLLGIHSSGILFVFIIWAILVTLLFRKLTKRINDLKLIDDTIAKIAVGDYNVKLEEDNYFRTMARNLNKTSDSLSLAIEKELKSERMKTELITNVSHDLKTPLTSIINYSELLTQEGNSEEEIVKYSAIINDKSHRLKDLIENLFEVSKVNSKNVDFRMIDLDFGQMVDQISGEWSDKFAERGLKMVINRPDQIVSLRLDGQQTSRILENIFSNIYKYALENTRVYIDLIKKDKTILTVKNISKYPLNISAEELLERFTRGDESRSTEGSGLGLSIASSLTELQGGQFNIEIIGDLFQVEVIF